MPIESYQQAISFWQSRVDYEQRGMPSDPRELKLDRMRELLHRLGSPEQALRIVHIAGTKGKGSVAAFLSSVLQKAGHRTGLFTSPHLTRVEERVQVDGQPIPPDQLVKHMRSIERVTASLEGSALGSPTFFEIVTALGFLHFAEQSVDVAVVEVGLGGRFDSTNVCDPLLSVITSIAFDHTQQLGNTLAAIAFQKAGIIKPGRPVVSGVAEAEPREVIERIATERGAPLRQVGVDFQTRHLPGRLTPTGWIPTRVRVESRETRWPEFTLGLLGGHQAANAAVVLACIEELRSQGWAISDEAVADGLRYVSWPARMEVLATRPIVIVDSAHNVASCSALVQTLEESFTVQRRYLVLGVSRDKDLAGMVKVLVPYFDAAFMTRCTTSQRGADASELLRHWHDAGGRQGTVCSSPAEAWRLARASARPSDLLCIAGSVFLAGELRDAIKAQLEQEPAGS